MKNTRCYPTFGVVFFIEGCANLSPKGFQSKDFSKEALETLFLPNINKICSRSHGFH